MNNTEKFYQIGKAIDNHRKEEIAERPSCIAVGHAVCDIVNSYKGARGLKTFWLCNEDQVYRKAIDGLGIAISKNSAMGSAICLNKTGRAHFSVRMVGGGRNNIDLDISSLTSYTPTKDSASEFVVNLEGEQNSFYFQSLSQLLTKRSILIEKIEQKKEVISQHVLEAPSGGPSKIDIEKEQKEIAELEQQVNSLNEHIEQTRSFVRSDMALRSQHLLDSTQENAKRCHIFDGTPIVINGGPGTGKTTTMIQRLRFLLSEVALQEHKHSLTESQLSALLDPTTIDSHWLFFSPTPLLLSFLKENMNREGLKASAINTTILKDFRQEKMLLYGLTDPSSQKPFRQKSRATINDYIILKPEEIISAFDKFCVETLKENLRNVSSSATVNFAWHKQAIEIKAICKDAAEHVNSLEDLMMVFLNLRIKMTEIQNIITQENILVQKLANNILNNVTQSQSLVNQIGILFESWKNTTETNDDTEDINGQDQTETQEQIDYDSNDFRAKLYTMLKALLKNLSLRKFNQYRLSPRQKELYPLIDAFVDKNTLEELADLVWFDKTFGFLCRGIWSNVLNQIPSLYKRFRKAEYAQNTELYNIGLLANIIKDNKILYPDEVDLVIGFINEIICNTYKYHHSSFVNENQNKYVKAYKESVKYIIGVDEATDYTLLDYYLIKSFLHYEFSSLTLCGDIMQGLNTNGIKSWEHLSRNLLPKLEVFELAISYRQLPPLVEMSKQIYKEDQNKPAPYNSKNNPSEFDPAPLSFVSDDESLEMEWVAKRIVDVYHYYGNTFPSIAIFVGDNVDIKHYIDRLYEQDCLNDINIVDGVTTQNDRCVRVFQLSQVKGMEFEVAIFHYLDEALPTDKLLKRRYIYVGISRAATHLAATFKNANGNEDVLAYFPNNNKSWRQ